MWLLAKLGLSVVDGKTLIPFAALLASCAALVAISLYGVHTLTARGYDKAAAECKAATQSAQAEADALRTKNADVSRDVIIKYVSDKTKRLAALPRAKQEVANDAIQNPVPATCALDVGGLRLWNRPVGEYRDPENALYGGWIFGRGDQSSTGLAAASSVGRSASAPPEQGGQQGSVRSTAERVRLAREANRPLPSQTNQ